MTTDSDVPRDEQAKPRADLDQPVENPMLVRALAKHDRSRPLREQGMLVRELNAGLYLVPALMSPGALGAPDGGGGVVLRKDTKISLLVYADVEGRSWLPLFSDWGQVRRWTSRPVQTLVMPAPAAWDFALREDSCAGAVINPADHALKLDRGTLMFVKRVLGEGASKE